MATVAVTEALRSLSDVEAAFGLRRSLDLNFFPEWREGLPELSVAEEVTLDRVKTSFLYNSADGPLTESTVNLLVTSPLLYLAGFCDPPFKVRGELSVEISGLDNGQIYTGRIDALVLQERIWLVLVESKQTRFSFSVAIPQALAYLMAAPAGGHPPGCPLFALVTNGEGFLFVKVVREPGRMYGLSDDFSMFTQSRNELYEVLRILRRLGTTLAAG